MLIPLSPLLSLRRLRSSRHGSARELLLPPGCGLYAKGRFALAAGLRRLREGGFRGRVLLPAYLCRTVLEGVEGCGLEPRFFDVGPDLAPRLETLGSRPGDALLLVHFFGLTQPMAEVMAACRERELVLIEDGAHGLPDPNAPVPQGASGDMAFFSLRKQLPVPDGGVLWMKGRPAPAVPSPTGRVATARTLLKTSLIVVEGIAFALDWNFLPLKERLLPAPAEPGVPSGHDDPGEEPRPSRLIRLLLGLADLEASILNRRENYARLCERLRRVPGVEIPVPAPRAGSVPQVVPIWVRDPLLTVARLRGQGIEAVSWPGLEHVQGIDRALFPGTAQWLDRNVCLPLHPWLTPRHLDHIAQAVETGRTR